MSDNFFTNADELKEAFDFPDGIYTDYTPLNDIKVGFSIQRKYPADIQFKPPKFNDGTDSINAILWVVYDHPYSQEPKTLRKVPLRIRIAAYNKYLDIRDHLDYDYDYDDEKCPTQESVLLSQSTPKPLELVSRDRYFYNHFAGQIVDDRNNPIKGIDILDELFRKHCKTSSRSYVWKSQTKKKFIPVINVVIKIIAIILLYLFGRRVKEKEPGISTYGYIMNVVEQTGIDVFGYKASKNVVFTFCSIILIAYSVYWCFNIKSKFISKLASNNLLTFCVSIILIGILDYIIPNSLLIIINKLEDAKTMLTYHKAEI
jgi:hypothetical protein